MTPLVSVIIPIYNAEAYLKETLDSVLASDYEALEVVMMDDGSTDGSLAIAQEYAQKDVRCKVLHQDNAGVSAARNKAIQEAQGKYILPVDADDKISTTYIRHAVEAIEQDDNIRVVGCHARKFGAVNKEWKLPRFSYPLLARKNMIPVSSLFRKADWKRCGGFCETDIYREDWDFWISMFELGGTYHLLDETGLYYRVHKSSRRAKAKGQKRAIVDAINRRHPAYMDQWLYGPLRYHRSLSCFLNFFRRVKQIGFFGDWDKGETVHEGRNTIRVYEQTVIKHFGTPFIGKTLWYSWFGKSKARRSFENALHLRSLTPTPIAYREIYEFGILQECAYACQLSECKGTFNDLIGHPDYPQREDILKAIGRFTAQMHRLGAWHKDYSGGNILFDSQTLKIEVIDLNRMCWRLPKQPLMQFERLNIDREALRTMVTAYAQERGLDVEAAVAFVIAHRWRKHVKQGITNL